MSKKIAFKTLGCRLNQYETDALVSQFSQNGYQIVEFDESADAYIVNTCTVTNQGDKRSRYAYNNVIKRNSDAQLVVTGCMATQYKEKLEGENQINFVVDNNHKAHIFDLVDSYFKGESFELNEEERSVFSFQPAKDTLHTRSMIKIQDGCDNFCTYCIVPQVRGRAISRPVEEIIENINQVLDFGYKEIVLTGVNITRYDFNGMAFDDLIEQIVAIPREFRLRISSVEPEGFTPKLYKLLEHPKVAPHLHLCIQSGSDKVLLQMRRFYTIRQFTEIVENIRRQNPDFNITTDIIVGFPDETEQDFEDTMKTIDKLGFTHIHTFKYSKRNHTRAARMNEQVDEKIKTVRSEEVRMLAEKNKRLYRSRFIGKEQILLVERIENGVARGYGENYIPIKLKAENLSENQFYKVKLISLEEGEDPELWAELI
jgi:threonylcarbamoyladenosine tRNA methylthiotransferase MtaB